MKNIRIISDGTACGTQVLDADGTKIEAPIKRIEWCIDATGRIGEAKITFAHPIVELQGEIKDG
ncbi:hypothetical protein Herbaro_09420 [Herbaspirillum sp. WKF16]|uniref:hypothetical protein n=1 Tax=Herbaspirillum sp. WKF16 TaxID=3028312 RepID=UPI0023A9DE2C|nr:hypothetical protein [Herbaspirillum sp. WKF16]WDZ97979.1 hypothetical protein Herbaro_09420 [Herbaspirillum sp. WKF16]